MKMNLYDCLEKTENPKIYQGRFSQHLIDDYGYVDGYDATVTNQTDAVLIYEIVRDCFGYILQHGSIFYLDIENCGYESENLLELEDILYAYFSE